MALSPSTVMGIFTTMLGWILAISRPTRSCPGVHVVAFTSAGDGAVHNGGDLPDDLAEVPPLLGDELGLVVTPQMTPYPPPG
jgi:hypothetical protein